MMIMTEEKIKEIKKLLKKGVPEGEIKLDLANEGYLPDEISKAFIPPKETNLCGLYLTLGFIFLAMAIGFRFSGSRFLWVTPVGFFIKAYRADQKFKKANPSVQ